METLAYIERDNQRYYCFIEVCEKIFKDTPKSTVRNWLRFLNISTTPVEATAKERNHFRRRNASLGGTFGLIRRDDVTRVIEYRGEGARNRARLSSSSTNVGVDSTPSTTNRIVAYFVGDSDWSDSD